MASLDNYRAALMIDPALQKNFDSMFPAYGHLGACQMSVKKVPRPTGVQGMPARGDSE